MVYCHISTSHYKYDADSHPYHKVKLSTSISTIQIKEGVKEHCARQAMNWPMTVCANKVQLRMRKLPLLSLALVTPSAL